MDEGPLPVALTHEVATTDDRSVRFDLSRDFPRQPFIVRIEKGDELPGGSVKAALASNAGTAIYRLPKDAYTRVFQSLNNAASVIGRCVIYDE
jgi:hypothetical protein